MYLGILMHDQGRTENSASKGATPKTPRELKAVQEQPQGNSSGGNPKPNKLIETIGQAQGRLHLPQDPRQARAKRRAQAQRHQEHREQGIGAKWIRPKPSVWTA